MLDGESVKVRLHLSSNFFSGIYSIVELLIAIAFTQFVTRILECRNVRRIYSDKKSVEVTSSSLWIFADHGLTSKTLHRVTFCLSAVIIAVGTIGGFAIVGVTETDFETVSVKNLVKKAPSDSLVDFEKHVSVEENLVSATVLLLRRCFNCHSGTANEDILYHYTNDLDNITVPSWSTLTPLFNSTCVTRASGYEEQIALEFEITTLDLGDLGPICHWTICHWTVNEDEIPLWNVTQIRANEKEECPFRILETWCYRSTRFFSCVSLVQHSDGYSTSQIWTSPEERTFTIGAFRQNRPVDSPILKSMAFLGGTGVECDLFTKLAMSLLMVEDNASVKRVVRDRNVTEINILLFGLTFGLALFITTVLGIVAVFEWIFVLFLPGRLEYNRFSSATDLLCYSAVEAFCDEDMRRSNQAIAVGVSRTEPHVGPLKEPVGQGKEHFHEEKLVGLQKRRH